MITAEEALRQSQKMEAVGQLTGGLAHAFNNLPTVIRGSVDLLRRSDVSQKRRSRYIDAIADTADRAAKLTAQLLAFARRQALNPEAFDAGDSVQAVQPMILTLVGSPIAIDVEVGEQPCIVNADRSQFDTALVNMEVNARDAMDGDGELVMTVATARDMAAVRSHPAVDGAFVTIAVQDTGIGIAVDKIEKIFQPFFTTKEVGEDIGLGLSQASGFTKQSGGKVVVESVEGQGATFTMYLPAATSAPDHGIAKADEAPPLAKGSCILVVEDNPEVGQFATDALTEMGYNTILASDGKMALEKLQADGAAFDVVFSDVVAPGMRGVELGQEIRRRHPDLPIILTSGYSSVLADGGTYGFELLHKPYSVDELTRILRTVADRGNASNGDEAA